MLAVNLAFSSNSQEEEESKFWSSLENFLSLPDSRLHLDNNDSVPETAKETLDPNQEPDLGNAEAKDKFRIPNHKPEETGTSSGVPNYIGWTNRSAIRFPSGSSHASCASSQNWCGSRISPLPDFRGPKLDQVVAYEHELRNILKDNQPETLEDPPMSLNTVKIFEWSLHNQGKIMWSRNCSSYPILVPLPTG